MSLPKPRPRPPVPAAGSCGAAGSTEARQGPCWRPWCCHRSCPRCLPVAGDWQRLRAAGPASFLRGSAGPRAAPQSPPGQGRRVRPAAAALLWLVFVPGNKSIQSTLSGNNGHEQWGQLAQGTLSWLGHSHSLLLLQLPQEVRAGWQAATRPRPRSRGRGRGLLNTS